MDATNAISLDRVSKSYGSGSRACHALTDVTLCVSSGEFISVMGPSGSGKSTMLNILAGLDTPTGGSARIAGADLASLSEDGRSDLRLRRIGIVFQSFNLFPNFTAEENVSWPLEFLGHRWRAARARAADLLELVGIGRDCRGRRPATLSGGEQQRVAIARALVTEPDVLLADEPTGNLDSNTGESILRLLADLNASRAVTVVMVTHSASASAHGHRTVELCDGRILRETRTGGAAQVPSSATNGKSLPGVRSPIGVGSSRYALL